MVTVIADKEELITPVHNGVHVNLNDNERPFQYIKDYQEVDFHRSSSCKPLPGDFFEKPEQSSIQGTYFLQIDAFETSNISSNNISDQTEQINDNSCLLLTLTDGVLTVKGITIESIPDLSSNVRPGCKLLLTGVIPIKNGLLQLSSENTRFQYGSRTYPRPKSAYRGRGGGSYRVSNEGRRGGYSGGNSNETNFFRGPPPKTTLMDFMTSLKITNQDSVDNSKTKDRYETKRRHTEQYQQISSENDPTTNHLDLNDQPTNSTEQIIVQQDGINDQLDSEDDPTHSNYRERRNPLPPRLQRAQEERTRRNTVRYYDETSLLPSNEINENYGNETATTTTTAAATAAVATVNQSSSSSSSYSRRGEQTSYIQATNPSTINPYTTHRNILTTVNGSPQTHLAYFPTNQGPLIYNLAGIPSPPFANPSSYPNDPLAFCYSTSYATPTYLPASINHSYNSDSKTNINRSTIQTSSSVDENETKSTTESQQEENHDAENKEQISSSSSTSSCIDANGNSQPINSEVNENKHRDSNSNPRPRWKVGDVCLARWHEDREFYVATVVQIHPPTCTVQFHDYNNYDQVHFNDLKLLPRDQPYYSYISPSTDLNALATGAYFTPRSVYYPSPIDGCIIMPEAPPFPFNSAGTLYMYPPPMASVQRSNRYSSYPQSARRQENGLTSQPTNETTLSSSSTPSKNSSTISVDDQQQQQQQQQQESQPEQDEEENEEDLEPCSIADAPMILVKEDDEREQSTSNNTDQGQSTNENSAN